LGLAFNARISRCSGFHAVFFTKSLSSLHSNFIEPCYSWGVNKTWALAQQKNLECKKGVVIMMFGYGMGFGWWGLLFMFLFWGGLILLAILAVRTIFQSGSRSPASSLDRNKTALDRNPTAREILVQRYARGEIDREQYQTMMEDIG
jgi:putative membrane protein